MPFTDKNVPLRNTPIDTLVYNNFKGYTLVDDPTVLQPGFLVEGSRDVDLTRELGALAKRRGIEAQITSLGNGSVKGIHTFKHSAGDRILFGHGTNLEKLSGIPQTVAKTTTADFEAGTLDGVDTSNNELKLTRNGTESIEVQQISVDSALNNTDTWGQSFQVTKTGISAVAVYIAQLIGGESVTCNFYDNPAKSNLLGTKALSGAGAGANWYKFDFPNVIAATPGTTHYFELVTSNNMEVQRKTGNPYANGSAYKNGAIQTDEDLAFKVYTNNFYTDGSATYTFDLGTTPVTSALSWNLTQVIGCAVTFKARGSEDGQTYGDWQSVLSSGAGIPLTRYIQIEIDFTTLGSTSKVLDFTISYETAFTQATAIKTGLSGNTVRFTDLDDVCYFTDGGRPQRYDATNVRNVGVDPPGTAPTLATGAAGALSGAYKGLVTYINEYGAESNPGTASSTVSPSSQKIAWSNIPTGPAGTQSRVLYRTKANGSEYFRLAVIENNTATTYTDNVADSALGEVLVYDNDIPPDCAIVYPHKAYMLYATGNEVYPSKPGYPDNVALDAAKEFLGNVLAMKTFEDAAIIGGESFIQAVIGDIWDADLINVDNTDKRTIDSQYGPLSHEAMVECYSPTKGNILVFPTRLGLGYLTPGLQEGSLRNIPLSRDVQPIFDEAVRLSTRVNMGAIFDKGRYILTLNFNGTETPVQYNNVILIYDFRTERWNPPWYIPASGFCIANGKVYFGSPTIGQIYEFEKGTSDDGEPINSIAYLGEDFTPYGSYKRKSFKRMHVTRKTGSDTSSLEFDVIVDGVSRTIGPITDWQGDTSKKQRVTTAKGHKFQLVLRDESTNDWIIPEITTEYQKIG